MGLVQDFFDRAQAYNNAQQVPSIVAFFDGIDKYFLLPKDTRVPKIGEFLEMDTSSHGILYGKVYKITTVVSLPYSVIQLSVSKEQRK